MKILTTEIIQAELFKRGVSEKQIEDDPSGFTEKVLNHYDATFDDSWSNQDLYVYEESTRDGYSIWICTHNPNSICIAEDVYQNQGSSDIIEEIQDAIRTGSSIYCDASELIDEAVEDMLCSFYDDVQADVELQLINEGYAWPIKIPQLLQASLETISNHNSNGQYNKLLIEITSAIEQHPIIKNDN